MNDINDIKNINGASNELKVLKICEEMFNCRKYVIDEVNEEELYINAHDNNNKNIRLYICLDSKLNINLIKYYHGIFIEDKITHGIVVYKNVITSKVKTVIKNINIKIELFKMEDLNYNILKHELVPEHTKIDEKRNDPKKYEKYPIIKKSDPVVRFLGFNFGDIILIKRKNNELYIRCVG